MNAFLETFHIAGRPVGSGHPVLVIAEAGVAHFGDPQKAEALVDLAADAGADAFKTQAFLTDELVSSSLPEWRDRLRPKEVDFDFLARMKERCDRRGLIFLCTAHDEAALDWVDRLEVPAYKIGSGERGNLPFLGRIASRGKPILLSTGMYEETHVRQALDALSAGGCNRLALFHCVTCYPVPVDQANLRALASLRAFFNGPLGYSDHTEGHLISLLGIALGASLIEKHITLDFNVPNAQDWKVSCGPEDFKDFVAAIRKTESALGDGTLTIQLCEQPALAWALKSLVTARALPAGTVLSPGMLTAKRPGGGIAPSQIDALLGRVIKQDIAADQPLRFDDLT